MDGYDDDIELLKFSYVFSKSRNPLKLSCTFFAGKASIVIFIEWSKPASDHKNDKSSIAASFLLNLVGE